MEIQLGVKFTILSLPDKQDRQLTEIRNMYIARGETTMTLDTTIARAIDALHKIEQMQENAMKQRQQQQNTGGQNGQRTAITKPESQPNAGNPAGPGRRQPGSGPATPEAIRSSTQGDTKLPTDKNVPSGHARRGDSKGSNGRDAGSAK